VAEKSQQEKCGRITTAEKVWQKNRNRKIVALDLRQQNYGNRMLQEEKKV
jgi:hypothetical protein